jgi:hypothetical protein
MRRSRWADRCSSRAPSFNRNRDRLFFFYSLDYLPRTDPFLVNSTLPSALERSGDFSQTRNNAGVLRHIRDPLSGLRAT